MCAAAVLIVVVFSDLRRDLVGPVLFRVASSCWQHCFCFSALVGFSCISSFPVRVKGEIEGKNDWKALVSLCPFIDFPDQVTSSASSGILVAAATLVMFYATKKAFLSAAASVLSHFGAAAACSCASSTAAAGNINANEGMFALVGQVFLGRPLALVEIYFAVGSWCLQLRLSSLTRRGRLPWLQLRLSWCSSMRQMQTAVFHVQQL